MVDSSAKNLLKKNKEKNLKKKIETYHSYAANNLAQIAALLQQHRPADHEAIFEHVLTYLDAMKSGGSAPLSLPPMDLGLASLLLNNISLWLGNTQQVAQLANQAVLPGKAVTHTASDLHALDDADDKSDDAPQQ